METEAMRKRADLYPPDESVIITKRLIEQYLADLKARGRQLQTMQAYQRSLLELYDFLPKEKEITKGVLEDWREALKSKGYGINTVNAKLVAVNGLLRYCGAEDLLVSHERVKREETLPKLTRSEYLQLLSAVYQMRKEREYLLIKVFACVGLNISELDCLTVESVKDGAVRLSDGKEKVIPVSLGRELLQYTAHKGIKTGAVFVTRSGKPMDRSNITNAIRKLAERSGMEPERCNPRALHRMYQTTYEEMVENLEPFYKQSYDKLLNMEQSMVEWK